MKKAQGSLEYLIIIAAILAISGVVVYFVVGSSGDSIGAAQFAECKKAASQCNTNHLLNPADPCMGCDNACIVNGKDIMAAKDAEPSGCGSACYYCKQGDPISIMEGGDPYDDPGPVADCTEGGTECETPNNDCLSDGVCVEGTCVYDLNEFDGFACPLDAKICTRDVCSVGVCTHPARTGEECIIGDVHSGTCLANGFCDQGAGGCFDNDRDGYGVIGSTGCQYVGDDCDDTTATGFPINPGAVEICGNEVDEDCDFIYDNGCPTATILSPSPPGVTTAESSWPLGSDCTEGTISNVITNQSSGIYEFWNLDPATCAGVFGFKMKSVAVSHAYCDTEPSECSWVTRHFTGMGVGVEAIVDYEVYAHHRNDYYDRIRVWVSADGSSWNEICNWYVDGNMDFSWSSHSCSFLTPSSDFYVKILNDPSTDRTVYMSIREFDVEIANKDIEYEIKFMGSATGASISKYEWDFNGDGSYEWNSDANLMYNYSVLTDCSTLSWNNIGNVITNQSSGIYEFWNLDPVTCAGTYGYKMKSVAVGSANCATEPAECSWVTRHFTGVDANVNVDINYDVYLHRSYSYYEDIRVWVSADGSSWNQICSWNPGWGEDFVWISHSCSFLTPSSDFYVRILNDPYTDRTVYMSIRKFDAVFNAPVSSFMDKVVYHSFGSTGTFTPTLRVTDTNGKQATATVTYNVN